jgi:TonB family protein
LRLRSDSIAQIPAGLKLKHRIQRVYPQSSKDRREQGAVTFYGVIGEDGKITKPFLIQSAGADLDKSSAAAVSQWVYEQPMCEGVLTPIETTIDVIFQMRQ